jgi:putative glutamine amidotransferase
MGRAPSFSSLPRAVRNWTFRAPPGTVQWVTPAMTADRPLIGVTTSEMREARRTHPLPEGDPPQHEMALGMPYMKAIEAAGGLPVVLPPLRLETVEPFLDHLAGICLSGGPDLDPQAYGAAPHPMLGPSERSLDRYELALARAADRRQVPLLGICRGAQTLNVARGGTLHQHVDDVLDGSIHHRQKEHGRVPTHEVEVVAGSRLARITGDGELAVNSFHHQAVDHVGRGLRVVARSPDGLVEAVEDPGLPLWLGVQWHAEMQMDRPEQAAIFRALVDAAAARAAGLAAAA